MDEELLQDLEDLGEGEDDNIQDDGMNEDAEMEEADGGNEEAEGNVDIDPTQSILHNMKATTDVKAVAKLVGAKSLKDTLQKIDQYIKDPPEHLVGSDEHPEYRLIVQSNKLSAEIDNELLIVHKFIRDKYAPKFPELEQLVLNPLDYARVVQIIDNRMDVMAVGDQLRQIGIPFQTVMLLTIEAQTTKGRPLTEAEMIAVREACQMALELEAAKRKIFEYIELRMSIIAPNLSAIVGSGIAAKLLGVAGGLAAFLKIPACNVLVLGQQRKISSGLSIIGQKKHMGLVYNCTVVVRTPEEYQRRAAKLVAAKCVLAARIDRTQQSPDGSAGRKLREDIEKKLEKEMEPPPGKSIRALPVPDEGPKKRRGGKQARKMKEKMAMTELRRQQNRMSFGVAEEEVGAMDRTKGLGLIGGSTGKIRVAADARTKVKLSKKYRTMTGSSGNTSGLSSSLAFTPVQGLELENPEASKQRVKEANDKYFGGGKFLKVGEKS
ncbi:Nop domain-containing protein [Cladochytrium replicatum]|nr:Nop domain-containing protein [Cladochytrium replicatum]